MDLTTELVSAMASRWWMLIARGAIAIMFGLLTLAAPNDNLLTLLLWWGTYATFDGLITILLAAQRGMNGRTWGWLFFEGTFSLGAGLLTLMTPGMTAFALLSWIAARAACSGVAEIAEAIRLRGAIRGEWLLATSGVLSAAFGITMLLFRSAGALAAAEMIGGYALIFGALLVAFGLRIHRWYESAYLAAHPSV